MKLVTFQTEGKEKTGILEGDRVIEIISSQGKSLNNMLDLIDAVGEKDNIINFPLIQDLEQGKIYEINDVKILAPVRYPRRNFFCLGMNYADHAKEVAFTETEKKPEVPKFPVYFSKLAYPALEDKGIIPYDEELTKMVDYEVELAVIIGKEGKDIKEDEALNYVFGYTIANDISARNLQGKHGQWFKGKSVDNYAPLGPYILTADELENPSGLQLKCYVNDELRQNANTKDLVFSIPRVISDLSRGLTLRRGDVILTGTPSGVGLGFKPYKFVKSGDVIRCEIDKLGSLTTYIK
ncbi:MAG: fumarylacetoacetate hydrolase family protein [Eubacteriales bacterium]|nr:fumarylacetoacetate hydrolase family protein [Eubacteriales bacterium]